MAGKEPSEIVVDASVVAKWYVEEPGREDSLRIRDAFVAGLVRLHAPSLMGFEVVNAIRYAGSHVPPEVLRNIAHSLAAYDIALYGARGTYFDLSIDVSKKFDISIYDASYVALAQHLGCSLYTADNQLVRKATRAGANWVKHMSEFRSE